MIFFVIYQSDPLTVSVNTKNIITHHCYTNLINFHNKVHKCFNIHQSTCLTQTPDRTRIMHCYIHFAKVVALLKAASLSITKNHRHFVINHPFMAKLRIIYFIYQQGSIYEQVEHLWLYQYRFSKPLWTHLNFHHR